MPCLSDALVVVGGAMQIAGVAWAVFEIERIRRSWRALRKVGHEIAAEIQAMLRPPDEASEASPSSKWEPYTLTARSEFAIETRTQPDTLDERIARLETRVTELSKGVQADRKRVEARIKRVTEHADAIDRELRELMDAQERQRRESQSSADRLQRRIAPLLVTGLALSVVGSVTPC
jgi:chromosome segregation ATPase